MSVSRSIPWLLRIAIYAAGPIRQIGWAFMIVSCILCPILFSFIDVGLGTYDAVTSGVVQDLRRTKSKENHEFIYEVAVAVEEPAPRVVRSYTVAPPERGAAVTVEYDSSDPSYARMRGATRRPLGRVWLMFLLFPVLATFAVTRRFTTSRRAIALLRHGELARARPVAKRDGVDTYNDVPEAIVTMEYVHPNGMTYRFEATTFSAERLYDDPHELILFDPSAPHRALALDLLPGTLMVTPGKVVPRSSVVPLAILPVLAALTAVATALTLYAIG